MLRVSCITFICQKQLYFPLISKGKRTEGNLIHCSRAYIARGKKISFEARMVEEFPD